MPANPTILQIIPRLDTGGAELSTIEIVAALVKCGARALVATEGGRLVPEIERLGGEVVPFPAASKNPIRLLLNASRLAAMVRREGIALLHARSRAPAWSALMAARRAQVPFVTTYHGAYGGTGRIKTWYNGVMARGDRVIANSQFTANLIRERHAPPGDRIRVIHRGVDMERLDPAALTDERIDRLRAAWGIESNRPVVLQAARLTSWKGQRIVIEAARLLRERGSLGEAVIILAGDAQGRDGYTEELNSSIGRAGLAGQVRLVGHCEDMAAAFGMAWLTVVASVEPEAFGRATTEALAMGCPVVATSIGAPPETVVTSPSAEAVGWLVPPRDAGALADRIGQALAMPAAERRSMGARARRHVEGGYTVGTMQKKTLAVYDELLGTDLVQRFGGTERLR